MSLFWRPFMLLLKKDLLLLKRRSASVVSVIFFSLLIIIIFQIGIDLGEMSPIPFAAPFIWLGSLFGGMLRMSRTFESETRGHVLEGYRLTKGIVLPLYLSKLVLNVFFMVLLQFLMFVVVVALFNIQSPLFYLKMAWLPFVLGAMGFSAVGTTFSGMVLGDSSKDLLLPVIAYPILSPLLIGVIKSFEYAASGDVLSLNPAWISLLIAFDLIYISVSILVFNILLESQ
ncbi:MAG: heme exporter protein CcmB [Deltaproteobacteria bacterium]|nr:MAG: heme exporter protein CcmB [Deltaproteobacteria bacterium]